MGYEFYESVLFFKAGKIQHQTNPQSASALVAPVYLSLELI